LINSRHFLEEMRPKRQKPYAAARRESGEVRTETKRGDAGFDGLQDLLRGFFRSLAKRLLAGKRTAIFRQSEDARDAEETRLEAMLAPEKVPMNREKQMRATHL
jgi:hypothetical protein